MTCINKTALIPYSAAKMYELVADVDSYQHFLPWCGGSKILSQTDDEVQGQVRIQHMGMDKTFTTLNRMQKNKKFCILSGWVMVGDKTITCCGEK